MVDEKEIPIQLFLGGDYKVKVKNNIATVTKIINYNLKV